MIGIVMPVRNGEATLKRTVEAIVKQDFRDWHLCIVDDGSDDPSFVPGVAAMDPRISFLRTSESHGPAASRNLSMKHLFLMPEIDALAFCDADDVWDAGHLSKLAGGIGGHGMAYSDCRFAFEDGSPAQMYGIPYYNRFDRDNLQFQNFIFMSSVLVKKDAVESLRFDELAVPMEDWKMWLDVSSKTSVIHLPGESFTYLLKRSSWYNDDRSARARAYVLRCIGSYQHVPGWLTHAEGMKLAEIARDRVVLEMGSYKGRSACYMAGPATELHCVDTFRADDGGQDQTGDTLPEFERNIRENGFSEKVVVHRKLSTEAAEHFEDESLDVVFVDAMHDRQSVLADIDAYWPKLRLGGTMCFHDYCRRWPGVVEAVNERFGGPREIVDHLAVVKKELFETPSFDLFAGKTFAIAPRSKRVPGTSDNPKDYPYWDGYVATLVSSGATVLQVGGPDDVLVPGALDKRGLDPEELLHILRGADAWVSVDTFLQHFAWLNGIPGIVVFSVSDPFIFGHKENLNILRSRKFLREWQFSSWAEASYVPESFVPVDELVTWTARFLSKPGLSGSVYSSIGTLKA